MTRKAKFKSQTSQSLSVNMTHEEKGGPQCEAAPHPLPAPALSHTVRSLIHRYGDRSRLRPQPPALVDPLCVPSERRAQECTGVRDSDPEERSVCLERNWSSRRLVWGGAWALSGHTASALQSHRPAGAGAGSTGSLKVEPRLSPLGSKHHQDCCRENA